MIDSNDHDQTAPPELIETVLHRPSLMAEASHPTEATIELFRLWNAKTTMERAGAPQALQTQGDNLVVTWPLGVPLPEPPKVTVEAVTADMMRGIDVGKTEGSRPLHLALNYAPAMPSFQGLRKILPGKGIPNAVFQPDTRIVFKDTAFPWSAVGRVETERGYCTGTMVGRRLMLTCGHIMKWTADGAGWVKFTPAYYDGISPFGIAWSQRVFWWARVDGSDGLSDQETAFDYVVCVLDRYLGDAVGWAGSRSYSSSWNGAAYWQQIGYPSDLTGGQRPVYTQSGSIAATQEFQTSGQTGLVMGNFIDTAPGHSGGPYWGWWGDEKFPRVIGTDSTSPQTPGPGTSGDNEAGGGAALTALIAYVQQQYP